MLEPDQWESALSTITGTVYRGTERVAVAILSLLQVTNDRPARMKAGKLLVSPMRRLGLRQDRGQRGLAHLKRIAAQVVAVGSMRSKA